MRVLFVFVLLLLSACTTERSANPTVQQSIADLQGELRGVRDVLAELGQVGDVEAGQVNAGDVLAGDVEAGAVSAGDVVAGQVNAGDVVAQTAEIDVGQVVVSPPALPVAGDSELLWSPPTPDPAAAWAELLQGAPAGAELHAWEVRPGITSGTWSVALVVVVP